MSSIVYLRDHDGKAAGATVSVPFHRGRDLIAAGIARYLNGPTKPTEPEAAPPKPPGEKKPVSPGTKKPAAK